MIVPAAAGKTTARNALRRTGETDDGHDSVPGLVPSAAATSVLWEDLGIAIDNTAKW